MNVKLYTPFEIVPELLSAVRTDEEITDHPVLSDVGSACAKGADALYAEDLTPFEEHEKSLHLLRAMCRVSACPVSVRGTIKRLEDIKKYLYAGASEVILSPERPAERALIKEASERFGKEKISVFLTAVPDPDCVSDILTFAGRIYSPSDPEEICAAFPEIPVVFLADTDSPDPACGYFQKPLIGGYCDAAFRSEKFSLAAFKTECIKNGGKMSVLDSALSWDDFKKNDSGLLPVIVQDYENDEVLMMAWMNREAFEETLLTGKMVYYSRSRAERWCKGETSGHYQYVRSLAVDCDRDTLLAKVIQVGAACHTGHRSCFYTPLCDAGIGKTDPQHVLESVYQTIEDRKKNPKEGSYTAYLFEKGIDKILKKLGEENAETIIAAKNPGSEEIVYEISDYLYHLMVLMAEKGVTWDDITKELARRH